MNRPGFQWRQIVTLFLLTTCPVFAGMYTLYDQAKQLVSPLTNEVSAQRVTNLSRLLQSLWELDENRLESGRDFEISADNRKVWLKFWSNVKPTDFHVKNLTKMEKPTFKAFIKLLDNYKFRSDKTEYEKEKFVKENWAFLNEVMKTKVMQAAHSYLAAQGLAPASKEEFKARLYEIWLRFDRSPNGGQFSTFEHVFVGEMVGGKVEGYHNWIHLYRQMRKGRIMIQDFEIKAGKNKPLVAAFSFTIPKWQATKHGALMLLGTSPEFELAAYTSTFLMGLNGEFKVGRDSVRLICVRAFRRQWRPKTCYPKG
ncbi:unnamed protein product [Calicophoron daubneyi]|uniref:Uridylate-specific endoribonuclease n=1 Tax=Calicophoron daubneyi TaxID=300641 RepID=A0AAV2T9U7_CALDB